MSLGLGAKEVAEYKLFLTFSKTLFQAVFLYFSFYILPVRQVYLTQQFADTRFLKILVDICTESLYFLI